MGRRKKKRSLIIRRSDLLSSVRTLPFIAWKTLQGITGIVERIKRSDLLSSVKKSYLFHA